MESANATELLKRINQTSPELRKAWQDFDIARLAFFRERVIDLLNKLPDLADEGLAEAKGEGSTRKMNDAIAAMNQCTELLNKLTDFKSKISLDSAVQEVTKAGYQVSDPRTSTSTKVETRHKAGFEDFLKWREQTNE